jgi:mRNA interferase MazF
VQNTELDAWNGIKKYLDVRVSSSLLFPKEREVWMCSWGRNLGYEQNGSGDVFSRPALVVKKFNNQMFWCVPLSTKQKAFDFYYNFTDPDSNKVSAIIAQMRLLSVKRFSRKLYELSIEEYATLKESIIKTIS